MSRVRVMERGGMPYEIVLPETKPETEWIAGRAVRKVSPTYTHALLQRRLSTWVGTWADLGHGRAGPEWRFRVAPPDDVIRPLVPDVSYISYGDLPADTDPDDVETPLGAPTVAFEVRSRSDREADLAAKIATLLAAGAQAIVVVDPRRRTVVVHDANGVATHLPGETMTHPSMPGFALALDRLFADLS